MYAVAFDLMVADTEQQHPKGDAGVHRNWRSAR